MSSKHTTTNTLSFDPSSMSAFQSMQPSIQQNWAQDSQTDVTKSSTYNLGLQNMMGNVNSLSARNNANFMANLKAGGYNGNNLSGVQLAGLTGTSMGNSGMQANAFNQNFMNYDLMRRQTVAAMSNYRPLQTGSTQVQQSSGLGTWLPQVVGAGLQAGAAFASGGASMGLSAGLKAGAAGAGSLAGSFMNSGMQDSGGGSMANPTGSGGFTPNNYSFGSSNSSNNPFNSFGSPMGNWGGTGSR